MTVIKDPGNQTESYLDGQVRMWRDTAGLWRGSARDTTGTVNGRATPGWGSGQLWSVSASQWEQNALAWYNNSGSAYSGGVWGSGTLWSTLAGQAYTGGTWGSGILWSTEAANRLAAGSGATPAYGTATGTISGAGGGNNNWATITIASPANNVLTFWTSGTTITCPLTGVYIVGMRADVSDGNDNSLHAGIRFLRNGGLPTMTFGTRDAAADHDPTSAVNVIGFSGVLSCNAGDTIVFQAYQSWGIVNAFAFVAFVPTPSNPH